LVFQSAPGSVRGSPNRGITLAVVFSGIATSRTRGLLAAHTAPPEALTAGFQRALLVSALCLVAAGAIALRASNTRGEPAATPEPQQNLEPSYDPA
jgi:hypothetical protein